MRHNNAIRVNDVTLFNRVGLLQSAVVGSGGLVGPEARGLKHQLQLKPCKIFLGSQERTMSPSRRKLRYHDMRFYLCALVSEWLYIVTCQIFW